MLFDGHELPASLSALHAFPKAVSILDAGSWREGTAQLAGKVDYLAASQRFAVDATGITDLDTEVHRRQCILQLRKTYDTTVIVTLGEQGVIADDGNGYVHLQAYPAKAVDTTAAGDIFHGAFAYALIQAMPFRACLRFASLAAGLSVRTAGGRCSIPDLAVVKDEFSHAKHDLRNDCGCPKNL